MSFEGPQQEEVILEENLRKLRLLSQSYEDFGGLNRESALQTIETLYGTPTEVNGFNYFMGNDHFSESWPIEMASGTVLELELNPLYEIIAKEVKGRVVIELGPSVGWVDSALEALVLGATMYVGIDIDKRALTQPDWKEIDAFNQRKDTHITKKELQKFVCLIVDDPIILLSKLEDHSAILISSAVFTEPLHKNIKYRERLVDCVTDKTFFGAHKDTPGYPYKSFFSVKTGRSERLEVSYYLKDGVQ